MAPLRYTLPCILAAAALVQASAIRGVAPDQQLLYTARADEHWECLDKSKRISYQAINDDYCDCPDGSDEPGTSACPNSLFYCENIGHIPAYIKSYAVNDGVCDVACCDGSDETNGLISCPNRCLEYAAEYAAEQAIMQKIHSAGIAAKRKLIQEGRQQVTSWQEEKSKLEDALVLKRAELMRRQSEIDALEADTKNQSTGKITKKVKCPPCKTATLREHVHTLEEEIETLITILDNMKRDHNHNYHDMAVKAAIAGYDEFIEGYDDLRSEIDKDLAKYSDEDDSVEIEQEEEEVTEAVNEEAPEQVAEQAGKVSLVHSWIEKVATVIPPDWRGLLPLDKGKSDSDKDGGSALEAAKKGHSDLNSEIQSTERKLNTINDDLAKDYGAQYEWLKLKDVCIEKNEGEYTYSVCIFGDAYQKSNKDGAKIKLGRFEKFVGDDHMQQAYTRGTKCWNGPERSVYATFECGGTSEILEVTEPEKCEYKYRMKTPAVCPIPEPEVAPPKKVEGHVHEEL